MSDAEILKNFQLLTGEQNLLKDRNCTFCRVNNKRPPFNEIKFWYQGDENYNGTCEGCGWHDGKMWRQKLNEKLSQFK